jgi:hypothetical protein
MSLEGGVRLVAGSVVLATTAMSHPGCPLFVSENLLFVAGFVGFMLVQSPFTGFCPSAFVLKKLGLRSAGESGAISPSP